VGRSLAPGGASRRPVRPNQMLTNALSATRTKKPLTTRRSAGGMRGVSGWGGGGPGNTWRQIAAPKQKALNRTKTVRTAQSPHSGIIPSRSFFAPTPLASAARPVRTQAA
jgi:hypothetical protein